jgi:2C-methyl-D-erythritol 2,4-cyclodiphosphate synthase
MDNTMIKEYLTSIIRTLLMPVFAYLAASGYISDSDVANHAMAIAALVTAVVWGLANKYFWKETTVKALNTPPPATKKKLEKVIEGE